MGDDLKCDIQNLVKVLFTLKILQIFFLFYFIHFYLLRTLFCSSRNLFCSSSTRFPSHPLFQRSLMHCHLNVLNNSNIIIDACI